MLFNLKKYRDIMSCYKYWGKIEEIADKLSNFINLDDDMDALDDVATVSYTHLTLPTKA